MERITRSTSSISASVRWRDRRFSCLYGTSAGTAKFASKMVQRMTPEAMGMSMSRRGVPSAVTSVAGTVSMSESVMPPFAPVKAIASVSRISGAVKNPRTVRSRIR